MKKIIAIWLGVIVILITGGIIYGQIVEKKETENEKPPVSYYDESGNPVEDAYSDGEIEIKGYDGNQYKYNPNMWVYQTIKFGGKDFKAGSIIKENGKEKVVKPNISDFEKIGIIPENAKSSTMTFGGEPVFIASFYVSDKSIEYIKVASKQYNDALHMFTAPCYDDVILPGNIELTKSTIDDVVNVYGQGEPEETSQLFTTLLYYEHPDNSGQCLELTFEKETKLLVAFKWSFH